MPHYITGLTLVALEGTCATVSDVAVGMTMILVGGFLCTVRSNDVRT